MVYILYDIGLALSGLVLIPYFFWRGFRRGRVRKGIRERFGFYREEQLAALRGRRTIWIHAVSVGETRAAIPLVKALRQEYPDTCLLMTTVTETGQEVARNIKEADLCLYFPFDLSWVVRRALHFLQPEAIIIVETEIWPNLIRLAHDSGIPLLLVNGRLSDRSFPRYKAAKFFVKGILEKFSSLCMQTNLDGQRIQRIGAHREKVKVTGNLKFDSKIVEFNQEEKERIRQELKISIKAPILVAGSTHEGEEEDLVRIFLRLLENWPDLVFILVPRHPGRCGSVGEMIASHGVEYTLRTRIDSREKPLDGGNILLVDTMGEMLRVYALGDIIFVGGSLVPIGGHNILEGSMLKKPVVFGHFMGNFKEISKLLQKAEGGICVQDGEELFHCLDGLLRDPEQCKTMGQNGFALLEKNKGATEKTLSIIKKFLRP